MLKYFQYFLEMYLNFYVDIMHISRIEQKYEKWCTKDNNNDKMRLANTILE